jgi:16S rRNA (adenine1518-N6/adenine1519-N6)-dimethyltransferase
MFTLINAGFATRRKMLRRTLAGMVTPEAFAAAGIDPTARAETLTLAEWARLSDAG